MNWNNSKYLFLPSISDFPPAGKMPSGKISFCISTGDCSSMGCDRAPCRGSTLSAFVCSRGEQVKGGRGWRRWCLLTARRGDPGGGRGTEVLPISSTTPAADARNRDASSGGFHRAWPCGYRASGPRGGGSYPTSRQPPPHLPNRHPYTPCLPICRAGHAGTVAERTGKTVGNNDGGLARGRGSGGPGGGARMPVMLTVDHHCVDHLPSTDSGCLTFHRQIVGA